jgi:UDP-2,3-diacylglucosamine hydrolase
VKLYIFSDIHIRRESHPHAQVFLKLFESLSQEGRGTTLLLAGDILDVCTGPLNRWKSAYPRFFSALTQTRSRIVYVEGNHDFGLSLAPPHKELPVQFVSAAWNFKAGGQSLHAVHGDGMNPEDRMYRLFRTLLRSNAFEKGIRWVPAPWVRNSGLIWSRLSRHHGLKDPQRRHREHEHMKHYVRKQWERGNHCVVMGHSHEYVFEQTAQNQVYLNCGYWPTHKAYFCIETSPQWRITPLFA